MSWSARLPIELRQGIEREAARIPQRDLVRAASELTEEYRVSGRADLSTDARRVAYAVTRMPATYAAIAAVVEEARFRVPAVENAADLGAGPGTAAWALRDMHPLTLVEANRGLIAMGRRLGTPGLWIERDLRSAAGLPARDLVVCAYLLGELDEEQCRRLVRMAWLACGKALVLIEPGTPRGFARIRELRTELIRSGAWIAAPCPHGDLCPMPAGDWCHFASRIERSSLHRRLKAGSLGYEDEKYSYVIASKVPVVAATSRVIRHPQVHSGFIRLDLCSSAGLVQSTISRSQKDVYKRVRQTRWGDAIDIASGGQIR